MGLLFPGCAALPVLALDSIPNRWRIEQRLSDESVQMCVLNLSLTFALIYLCGDVPRPYMPRTGCTSDSRLQISSPWQNLRRTTQLPCMHRTLFASYTYFNVLLAEEYARPLLIPQRVELSSSLELSPYQHLPLCITRESAISVT